MKRIWIASRDPDLRKELRYLLPRGFSLRAAPESPDGGVAVVDIDTVGLETLRRLAGPCLVLAVTARPDNARIMETVAGGAAEVLKRPLRKSELRPILDDIAGLAGELTDTLLFDPAPPVATCAIVGRSPAVVDVCKKLARLSQVDIPVLITGETGTGKELIAESIAQYSDRFGKPFVVINCASVPETLLESELFGFEKGAFTGATTGKPGLLRLADGGTVFLDEVGELPAAMQAKLLRFLQTQRFYPIGGTEEIQVDVRVLSATNRALAAMVRKRIFREDLYHRLSVSTVHVPPLRQRTEDIPPLVRFFIERYRHTAPRPIRGMTRAFLEKLTGYDWPGNIRELENTVRSAMAVVQCDFFTTHELRELTTKPPIGKNARREALAAAVTEVADEALARKGRGLYGTVHEFVDRALLNFVMERARENQSEAARMLGISRLTLRKKLGLG